MLHLLKNSFFVFLGACCFGILSTVVKLAYQEGFLFQEVMISQFGTGWLILLLLMLFFGRHKVTGKQFLRLAGVGLCTCLTGVTYYLALQSIPASIAVVLLFQFTWIGVIIEAVVKRQWPDKSTVISVIILFVGTMMAGGMLGAGEIQLNWKGAILGLTAALMMALFVFFSGRVETQMSPITRSFYTSTGGLILLTILFTPKAYTEISLFDNGLWLFGLILGVFGVVLPVLLFALGAPKISTGLATILGAGELPVAVIASVLVLSEQVTALQWIGVIVILLGIAYPQIAAQKRSGVPAVQR
ncbi:DMT family transporter [Paenibacillus sp. FSL W7-1279]|uniref:EamA family transporter n=1 Tax=Paenibacillus sp. FSL W7-1279 TaxID=2921697 RepID=UPI0030D7FA38